MGVTLEKARESTGQATDFRDYNFGENTVALLHHTSVWHSRSPHTFFSISILEGFTIIKCVSVFCLFDFVATEERTS